MRKTRKLLLLGLLVVGFTVLGLGAYQHTSADSYGFGGDCNSFDVTHFPYDFLCGGSNGDNIPNSFSHPNANGLVVNAAPGTPRSFPAGSLNSIDFTTSFHAAGISISRSGLNDPFWNNAPVLVWTYVLANQGNRGLFAGGDDNIFGVKYPNAANITPGTNNIDGSGGHVIACPGDGSPVGKVYNYIAGNEPTNNQPDVSPAAYNPSTGEGVENCGDHGDVVYWYLPGGMSGGQNYQSTFRLNLNPAASGSFCVRTSISVAYRSDNGQRFPPAGAGPADESYIANNVAKQSAPGNCYTVKPNTPPPPSSPVASVTMDCDAVHVGGLYDPDQYGQNVTWQAQIFDADGKQVTFPNGNNNGNFDIALPNPGQDHSGWHVTFTALDNLTPLDNPTAHAPNLVITVSVQGSCESASCTTVTADSNIPGGGAGQEEAGKPFNVHATITNPVRPGWSPSTLDGISNTNLRLGVGGWQANTFTGTALLYQLWNPLGKSSLPIDSRSDVTSDPPGAPDNRIMLGRVIGPGGSSTVSFTATAPSGIASAPGQYIHIRMVDEHHGWFGGACDVGISTFQRFTFKLGATASPDATEDPGVATYNTSLTNTNAANPVGGGPPGPPTPAPTTSEFYQVKYGSGVRSYIDGPVGLYGAWPPGPGKTNTLNVVNKDISGSHDAGDQYCAEIETNSYDQGYIGSGGVVIGSSNNNTDDVTGSSLPASAASCFTVDNKPFFKTYNAPVSAGGGFTDNGDTCSVGGELAAWNNTGDDMPTYEFGAGSQLSALALVKIVGFASAQTVATRSPTGLGIDLSFANSTNVDAGGGISQRLGGAFGLDATGHYSGQHCLSNITPASPPITDRDVTVAGGFSDGNLSGGSTVSTANDKSLYVKGHDIYITNNDITYPGTGNYDPTNPTASNVPSLVIKAEGGNIYIANNVKHLDGVYVAEKSGGRGGNIYTCWDGSTAPPVPPANNSGPLYANCNNQLTATGSFIADKINLARTYGSLRNEKPTITSTHDVTAGQSVPLYRYSCNGGGHYYTLDSSAAGCNRESSLGGILPGQTNGGVPIARGTINGSYILSINNSSGASNPTVIGYGFSPSAPQPPGTQAVYTIHNTDAKTYLETTNPGAESFGYPYVLAFYLYDATGKGGVTSTVPSSVDPPTLPLTCSNNNGVNSVKPATCASEMFDFNPLLYLSNPNIKLPDNGAPHYQAITSLPPVL